jgi:hypothetical protein
MADPVTLGMMSLASTAIGGGISAFGAEKSGQAQQQMYNYQAGVARINYQIDQQNKEYAFNQGEAEATRYGLKSAQQLGQIRAAQGASGLDVNSGSNADVQASQRKVAQMDMTTIRSNAAKTAYDFDVKSTMDLNQATMDVMAGQNAKTAGDIKAMSSLVGSAGSVSDKWLKGNQSGMWGS